MKEERKAKLLIRFENETLSSVETIQIQIAAKSLSVRGFTSLLKSLQFLCQNLTKHNKSNIY